MSWLLRTLAWFASWYVVTATIEAGDRARYIGPEKIVYDGAAVYSFGFWWAHIYWTQNKGFMS